MILNPPLPYIKYINKYMNIKYIKLNKIFIILVMNNTSYYFITARIYKMGHLCLLEPNTSLITIYIFRVLQTYIMNMSNNDANRCKTKNN